MPAQAFRPTAFALGGERDAGGGVSIARVVGSWSVVWGPSKRSRKSCHVRVAYGNGGSPRGRVASSKATKKELASAGFVIRLPMADA